MRVINLASRQSAQQGYEYYKNGCVLSYEQIGEWEYVGKVRDEDGKVHDVSLNVMHTRSTSCNCPFAFNRRVVCKHAVALYFAIFPDEARAYKAQLDHEEIEYFEWLINHWYTDFEDFPHEAVNKILSKK